MKNSTETQISNRGPLEWIACFALTALWCAVVTVMIPWRKLGDPLAANAIASLSAVATVAAVVVALWLAFSAERKQNLATTAKSIVAAAKVSVMLHTTVTRISTIEPGDHKSDSNTQLDRYLQCFTETLMPFPPAPDLDTLQSLVPLPNHCAARVATAYEQIRELQVTLTALSPHLKDLPAERVLELINSWDANLNNINAHLKVASEVCAQVTKIST